MAEDRAADPNWPPAQRAARRIWAGIGLLVFGRLDHLVDVVKDIALCPEAARYKIARHYITAIQKLVPLPAGMSLQIRPDDALAWLEANRGQLIWDEEAGRVSKYDPPVGGAVLSTAKSAFEKIQD